MRPDIKPDEVANTGKPHWTKGSGCLFMLIVTVGTFCVSMADFAKENSVDKSGGAVYGLIVIPFYALLSLVAGGVAAIVGNSCIEQWRKGNKLRTYLILLLIVVLYILPHFLKSLADR